MELLYVPAYVFDEFGKISDLGTSTIIFPPKKIQKSYYRCDDKFHLDLVLDMYEESTNYGIVLLSGKEYRCYILEINGVYRDFKLCYSGGARLREHNKGGQSQNRFMRHAQEQRDYYYTNIIESMIRVYMINNNTELKVKGLIIGGNSELRTDLMKMDKFQQYFSNKILQSVTIDEIHDNTVDDVYNRCLEVLGQFNMHDVNKIIDEIKNYIINLSDKLVFGKDNILDEMGFNNSIEKLIISDELYENADIKAIINNINYNYELHIVPHHMIEIYGGIVGIKFFIV